MPDAEAREADLTRRFLKYLNGVPGCYAIKIHGNEYQVAGTPDIIGCYRGQMFVVEVKRPGGIARPSQERQLVLWRAAGARAGVGHTLGEIIEIAGVLGSEESDKGERDVATEKTVGEDRDVLDE